MKLSAFIFGLAVKDIEASRTSHEKFGINVVGGKLATFTDGREMQHQLKTQRVQLAEQADESTTGPAQFIVLDPDENPILVDQHV